MGEINEKLDEILGQLKEAEKKKTKPFRLPWKAKLSKKKVEQGWVTVIGINNNRELAFTRKPVVEGVYEWEGTPYVATVDYMLTYKGKPAIIQPSWSREPFSPAQHYSDTEKAGLKSTGFKLILNYLRKQQIPDKKEVGGIIWWLIGGIAVIAGGYYLFKGGF